MTQNGAPANEKAVYFSRIYLLLSSAKEQASDLNLHHLVHLTNIAILQLIVAWDGVDAQALSAIELEELLEQKALTSALCLTGILLS